MFGGFSGCGSRMILTLRAMRFYVRAAAVFRFAAKLRDAVRADAASINHGSVSPRASIRPLL
jgi:hypothetical protein